MRLLVRNKKPPTLALMSEEEADVAASAIVAGLYKRWGTTAARKLFEDQETFERAWPRRAPAVELLKEGLPGVTVTRVVQGQSVILSVGD